MIVTKFDVCIELGYHLNHEELICVSKSTNCFGTSKRSVGNEFKNQCRFLLLKHENCCGIEQPIIEILNAMKSDLMKREFACYANDAKHIHSFLMIKLNIIH